MTLEKAAEGRRRVAPESDEGGSPKRCAPAMTLEKRAERLGVRQSSGIAAGIPQGQSLLWRLAA
jgi:hypothetical protein